jgi:hypothetical protein
MTYFSQNQVWHSLWLHPRILAPTICTFFWRTSWLYPSVQSPSCCISSSFIYGVCTKTSFINHQYVFIHHGLIYIHSVCIVIHVIYICILGDYIHLRTFIHIPLHPWPWQRRTKWHWLSLTTWISSGIFHLRSFSSLPEFPLAEMEYSRFFPSKDLSIQDVFNPSTPHYHQSFQSKIFFILPCLLRVITIPFDYLSCLPRPS